MKAVLLVLLVLLVGLVSYDGYKYYKTHIPATQLSTQVCGQGEGCQLSRDRVVGFDMGNQIPDVTLKDFEGNETQLYDLMEGKDKFVLSFVADWCSDCQRQDEKLKEYYNDLPDNVGVATVYVDFSSVDGEKTTNKEQAKEYVESQDYPFPIFWDENNEITNMIGGIKSTPTNFVLNEDGVIKVKAEEVDMDILLLPNEEKTYKDIK